MNKLLVASTALVALGLGTPAALAAEMALPAPVAAPVYTNWSGCHAGGLAGASWGTSNRTSVNNPNLGPSASGLSITGDFNLSGFTGGFDLGCDWQAGVWVFGIEGDWSATNKSGQAFGHAPFNPAGQHETQERWVATVRGRLGFTWWDRSFLYVTGGGAWVKVDDSDWNSTTGTVATGFQISTTKSGYVVGVGMEYALGYGWSARSEYLYEDFGTHSVPNTSASFSGFVSETRLYDHVVRAGLNYKFW